MTKIILVAAVLFSAQAQAGIVYNSNMALSQVAMSRNASGITSCGIRVTAVVEVGTQTRWYDFSGNAYRKGMFGLWKAGSYSQPTAKLVSAPLSAEKSIRTPAPTGFWLAEAGSNVPVLMSETTAAEDKGFTLGPGDFISTMKSVIAVARGESAQFSMAYKNEPVDKIISFKAPLSEADYATLIQCFDGLEDGIELDQKDLVEKK